MTPVRECHVLLVRMVKTDRTTERHVFFLDLLQEFHVEFRRGMTHPEAGAPLLVAITSPQMAEAHVMNLGPAEDILTYEALQTLGMDALSTDGPPVKTALQLGANHCGHLVTV